MPTRKTGFGNIKKGALTKRLGTASTSAIRKDKAKQKRIVKSARPGSAKRKAAVKKERQDVFALNAKRGFKKKG